MRGIIVIIASLHHRFNKELEMYQLYVDAGRYPNQTAHYGLVVYRDNHKIAEETGHFKVEEKFDSMAGELSACVRAAHWLVKNNGGHGTIHTDCSGAARHLKTNFSNSAQEHLRLVLKEYLANNKLSIKWISRLNNTRADALATRPKHCPTSRKSPDRTKWLNWVFNKDLSFIKRHADLTVREFVNETHQNCVKRHYPEQYVLLNRLSNIYKKSGVILSQDEGHDLVRVLRTHQEANSMLNYRSLGSLGDDSVHCAQFPEYNLQVTYTYGTAPLLPDGKKHVNNILSVQKNKTFIPPAPAKISQKIS